MLKRSEEALRRWKGVDEAIDRWLDERHQLIVLLNEFAIHADNPAADDWYREKLADFSSILIDYVSAGHFEFYQRLFEEGMEFEDRENVRQAVKLMELIEPSTEVALAFNDKYGTPSNLDRLRDDLSLLGEQLETRFEAEDWMISTLHAIHVDPPGA